MANKIDKGTALEELVKGSMDYTMSEIREAFRKQFPYENGDEYYVNEIFADHVIVSEYGSLSALKTDEYWKVTYAPKTEGAEGPDYVFQTRDLWEKVELSYQPAAPLSASMMTSSQLGERALVSGKKRGKKFEERLNARVALEESESGKKRIIIEGAMTAGIVNGNRRRYSANVISAAVAELRGHLHESNGQGMAVQVLGETEHPSDKGGRASFLETVVKWEDVTFNGQRVDVIGRVLETSKGKDILTLMEGGVMPGVSLRGYGDGKNVTESGDKIFEVSELHITGFDLVLEPSFENSAALIESINQSHGDDEMSDELLEKVQNEKADLAKQLQEAQKMIAEGETAKAQLVESQRKAAVEVAITEATKDLPFGKDLNESFVDALKAAELKDVDAVKKFTESKRAEYGKLAAKGALVGMGFDEKKGIVVLGDVLERETGTPEFARASFEITESLRKNEMRSKTELNLRAESRAGVFTAQLLARFDEQNKGKLINEARLFNEAELTTDLNLPYSVSRAIIAEAFPNLVAANLFDVGMMNSQSERIYFEAFTGETGYTVAITDEEVTAGAESTWYALAHAYVTPGTVVVTSNPAGTTYVEGTDFVIDYELGKIKALAAGAIDANDLLVDYSYNAIAKGENAEIERAKVTLSYQTLEATALRLADYISSEAIVFSRSQLGWDAVARTMANIIRQTRLNIDKALIEKGLAAALGVASNSGGTYDISADTIASFVEKLGSAKVLVANRYYEPTGILMSVTNADLLSNWDGFKVQGFSNAVLNSAGFAGSVKGLPVFASTQMREGWALVMNRELVMHRVFQPMTVKGPYPIYSNGKIIAGEQYYSEEYNGSLAPIGGKGAYVKIQA